MTDDEINDIDDAAPPVVADMTDSSSRSDHSPNRLRNVIIICSMLTLAVIVIFVLMRSRTATPEEEKEETVVSVHVAKVEHGPIAREAMATGTIVPSERADVSAGISAQITEMGQLKNKLVNRGDPIAVLSSADLVAQRNEARAAVEEARLNLETIQKVQIPQATAQSAKDLSDAKATADNARATYDRRKILYQKGGISLKELEASELAYTNAQDAYNLALANARINRTGVNPNAQSIATAKIRQAEDRLANLDVQVSRGIVRAPITGIVTDQYQFDGEFAQQGAKLATIADISEVIIKAQFADNVVANLKVGDAVTVVAPAAPDEKMTGAVSLISRSSDPQSRTVEVWSRFGNPRGLLPANGAVQVTVESEPVADAVVVPSSAVVLDATNSDEGIVMVVGEDLIAHETKVKVGIKQGEKVQIVDGLNGDETVVTEGNYSLPDGTKVEIAAEEEGVEE